jgi:tripartite-type tricarboxylate transporter receptor subunit TctC
MFPLSKKILGLALAAALVASAGAAMADDFPNRPARIVVGFPPGGINDIVARVMAERLTQALGQPVVVENRAGAGGTIGADLVAKSRPDGYTLLMGSVSNIAMAPSQYKALPYDPAKDFAPVALVAAAPNVLVVHPDFPVQSVRDLLAAARQKPGSINYASAGLGTSNHLTVELLQVMTGVQFNHVPYKGDAPGTADVVAGQVPMIFPTLPVALPFIKSGKLRAIAVSSAGRSSLLPEVPTVAESGGLPDFEVSVWVGIFAPAGTPREVVGRLNGEIAKIVRVPAVRERLAGLGAEPVGNSVESFTSYIRTELAKWSRVAKAAGITPN